MSEDQTEEGLWGSVEAKTEKDGMAIKVTRQGEILRTIKLEPDVTYIGRMPENHIALDDPKASRSHARIFRQGEKILIEDQASENGIKVNGKRVTQHALVLGDQVAIGMHTLELVRALGPADTGSRVRDEALSQATEEEWRMDRTVSVSSERMQALHLARMQSKEKAEPKAPKAPSLELKLQVGDRTVEKTIVFEKGRKRPEGQPDQVEVRIEIGPWVLEKKVTL